MSRRALICKDDLLRFARVSREEGVNIRARIEAGGACVIDISPRGASIDDGSGDLDERLARFGAE